MLKLQNNRNTLWQWDVGQSLICETAEGETIDSIHIGIEGCDPFYVVEPLDGLVAIYDELLQHGKPLIAYEYIGNEEVGYTKVKYRFTVNARPKATDYAYTPTESYSWEYWCERAKQYAEAAQSEVASIPSKMAEWWSIHKPEIVEEIKTAIPPYDDTEIRAEISGIQQELNDKMEFFKVVLEGAPMKFRHDGVVQNYADLEAKYRDDKYFLYAEYENVTFIPSLPPDDDPMHEENVIEFSAVWSYEGTQHITAIKINELEQIKIDEFECASSGELADVKKDLNDKVGFGDYASTSKGGVVKATNYTAFNVSSDGSVTSLTRDKEAYNNAVPNMFISKGTLENVLNIERSKLADTQNALLQAQRKIDLLYALNEGISYVWETDETEAHSKQIPSGAKQMGVEMIGGKSVVWNQLLDRITTGGTVNGITYSVEGDTIKISGTANADTNIAINSRPIKFAVGHKYAYVGINGSQSTYGIRTALNGNIYYSDTIYTYVASVPNTTNLQIRIANGNTVDASIKFSFVDVTILGSEDLGFISACALAHPEYNEGEIISSQTDEVVVRGKNLIDTISMGAVPQSGGVTCQNINGKFVLNGTAAGYPTFNWYFDKPFACKGDTVVLTNTKDSGTIGFRLRNNSDNSKYIDVNIPSGASRTITLDYNIDWFQLFAGKGETYRNNYIENIQIERGTTPTPYKPYIEPTHIPTSLPTLNSAGNVYDYVDCTNPRPSERVGYVWVDHHKRVGVGTINNVSKITDYGIASTGIPSVAFVPDNTDAKIDTSNVVGVITSDGRVGSVNAQRDVAVRLITTAKWYFYDNRFTSLEVARQMLDGVIIHYELAEEIVTPIELPTELTDAISVEGNGSITFVDHNGHNFIIPNRETYMVKVGEA